MHFLDSPVNVCGSVVKGFGRGSKELGIPTANFPEDVAAACSNKLENGVYFGWARVEDGEIYKMVMSIGWNPYYKNEKKSMETHIMHKYNSDFYDSYLRVSILGYIRPEKDFESLEKLIETINSDIEKADKELETDLDKKENSFLKAPISDVSVTR